MNFKAIVSLCQDVFFSGHVSSQDRPKYLEAIKLCPGYVAHEKINKRNNQNMTTRGLEFKLALISYKSKYLLPKRHKANYPAIKEFEITINNKFNNFGGGSYPQRKNFLLIVRMYCILSLLHKGNLQVIYDNKIYDSIYNISKIIEDDVLFDSGFLFSKIINNFSSFEGLKDYILGFKIKIFSQMISSTNTQESDYDMFFLMKARYNANNITTDEFRELVDLSVGKGLSGHMIYNMLGLFNFNNKLEVESFFNDISESMEFNKSYNSFFNIFTHDNIIEKLIEISSDYKEKLFLLKIIYVLPNISINDLKEITNSCNYYEKNNNKYDNNEYNHGIRKITGSDNRYYHILDSSDLMITFLSKNFFPQIDHDEQNKYLFVMLLSAHPDVNIPYNDIFKVFLNNDIELLNVVAINLKEKQSILYDKSHNHHMLQSFADKIIKNMDELGYYNKSCSNKGASASI